MSTTEYQSELTRAGANVNSRWDAVRFFVRRYPLGAAGAVIMAIFLFVAAFAPYITYYDPLSTNAADSLAPPGWQHLLGADFMGRDVYSRIVYGARISLAVAVGAMALGSTIGVIVGLLSGYLLGWFDLVTQRILEMMQSLPLLVLAIIMAAALGPSLHNTIIAIAIPLVPYVARVIRSNTLSLREQPFVEAAKATGMSEKRIALRHILPNTLAPLIVLATAQIGSAILIESSLSFLGLGMPITSPSLGLLIANGYAHLLSGKYWMSFFPGVALLVTIVAINLVGDHLRDVLNPRLQT